MAIPISDKLANDENQEEFYRRMLAGFAADLRVSTPGIIQAFDSVTQTVTVQVAVREKIIDELLDLHWIEIPLLLDVPIVIPRAGGFALTLPIAAGDECLVIFADMCIDAWFASGGIQNQIESRRHNLSDGFALIGVWSQPRVLTGYSTNAAQLRSDDGSVSITLAAGTIDINAPIVRINGVSFSTHTHVAPSGGGVTTGPS